jgi:uncharacterized protein (TIGR02145 family)
VAGDSTGNDGKSVEKAFKNNKEKLGKINSVAQEMIRSNPENIWDDSAKQTLESLVAELFLEYKDFDVYFYNYNNAFQVQLFQSKTTKKCFVLFWVLSPYIDPSETEGMPFNKGRYNVDSTKFVIYKRNLPVNMNWYFYKEECSLQKNYKQKKSEAKARADELNIEVFTDSQEGKKYKSVKIGNQVWMAENLNYFAKGSKCATGIENLLKDENSEHCDKYGRFYDWPTAMALDSLCGSDFCVSQVQEQHRGICPEGWHLPGMEEWAELIRYANIYYNLDRNNAGTKLKAKNGWKSYKGTSTGNGTDDFGFAALPSGDASLFEYGESEGYDAVGYALGIGSRCYWWSTTEGDTGSAYFYRLHYEDTSVTWRADGKRHYLVNARCVKDDNNEQFSGNMDYSLILQTHFSKGMLGEYEEARPIEMFFESVSKKRGIYSVRGKSKTKAAEDAFSGKLVIYSIENRKYASSACKMGENEINGVYDLNENVSKTSGRFTGHFVACEKNGMLLKAFFYGDWIKHSNGNRIVFEFAK